MSNSSSKAMPGRVVTAQFPSRAVAEGVRDALERLGISPDNIRLVENAPNPASVETPEESGWTAFADSQPHDEIEEQKSKGIPEGAVCVGVEIDEARQAEVTRVLRESGGATIRSSTRR
jgi:hypothetical protein